MEKTRPAPASHHRPELSVPVGPPLADLHYNQKMGNMEIVKARESKWHYPNVQNIKLRPAAHISIVELNHCHQRQRNRFLDQGTLPFAGLERGQPTFASVTLSLCFLEWAAICALFRKERNTTNCCMKFPRWVQGLIPKQLNSQALCLSKRW